MRTRDLCLIAACAIAACVEVPRPTELQVLGSTVNAKQDDAPRANLVFADIVNVAAPGDPEQLVAAGIQGDGRLKGGSVATGSPSNEYQGNYCGVAAALVDWSPPGGGRILTFDPNSNYTSSMASACGQARTLLFYLDGPGGAATANAPLTRVFDIYTSLAVGDSRSQSEGWGVGFSATCGVLQFSDAYAPASNVLVTRLADVVNESGATVRQWRVESSGSHRAACTYTKKNGAIVYEGVTRYLPFAVTVTEVPFPAPTFP